MGCDTVGPPARTVERRAGLCVMTSKPTDHRDWHEQRIEELRRQRTGETSRGQPESPQSKETFPQRERKPGEAGLANEARPGLGSRADKADPAASEGPKGRGRRRVKTDDTGKPKATPYGYEEPRPEPREQAPDTMAHDQERSTGTSGHMGIG